MLSAEEIAQAKKEDNDLKAVYRSQSDATIKRGTISPKLAKHVNTTTTNGYGYAFIPIGLLYQYLVKPGWIGKVDQRQLVVPHMTCQSYMLRLHKAFVAAGSIAAEIF